MLLILRKTTTKNRDLQINYENSENFKVKAEFKLLVGNVI